MKALKDAFFIKSSTLSINYDYKIIKNDIKVEKERGNAYRKSEEISE